jgi:hypothetical protein
MAQQKEFAKIFAVTYDEHGNLEYIKTEGDDALLELGEVVTRRASHVEPVNIILRVLFHILRTVVSDKSAAAAWTRVWPCLWRVNTAPVGGPVLRLKHLPPDDAFFVNSEDIAVWRNRQDAIDAEIKFLNEWFLTH